MGKKKEDKSIEFGIETTKGGKKVTETYQFHAEKFAVPRADMGMKMASGVVLDKTGTITAEQAVSKGFESVLAYLVEKDGNCIIKKKGGE